MLSLLKRAHAAIKNSIKRLKKVQHAFAEHDHAQGPTGAIFEAITGNTNIHTDDNRDDVSSTCFTIDGFEEHVSATEGDDGCTDASDEYESTFHMRFGARVLQPIPEIGADNFPEPVLYLDGWDNTADFEDEHVLAEQGCFESEVNNHSPMTHDDSSNGDELEMISGVETSGTESDESSFPPTPPSLSLDTAPTQPNTIWHIATELAEAAGVTEAETGHHSAWSALSNIPDYVDKTMAWDVFLGEIFYKLSPSRELKPGMVLAAMRTFNKKYPESRFMLVETSVADPKDRERSNVVDGQKRETEVPTNHSRGVSSAEGSQRMNASMDEPRKQAVKESRVVEKEHRAHDEELEKRWAAEYCSTIYLQAWMHLAGMTLVLRDIKQKQRQHARQERERRLCGGGCI